ncbi:hypothetical protein AYJ54_05255 [Bradyrhizobium centrolobii]|uniref:Uncharacterized protein n=1 Tax=Bradyrhizobium centrolobii TaxID=1505087 RepID=A0A176Z756_9BRAD|nr:hypothetical protein AYJ54_05255 [Bradyrhizobium centrolobii]
MAACFLEGDELARAIHLTHHVQLERMLVIWVIHVLRTAKSNRSACERWPKEAMAHGVFGGVDGGNRSISTWQMEKSHLASTIRGGL